MTQMGDSIRRRRGPGRRRKDLPDGGGGTGAGGGAAHGLDLKRWILGGVGGAALAFLLGWLIATQIMFPKPALAGDEVAVPDMAGLTLDQARTELSSTRLEPGDVLEMVHPEAERGVVIAQDPIPGMLLRPGAEVRLAVSRGRARATVPALVGMPADAAIELARRVGFEPSRVDEPTIEEAGVVLRTNPAAGQQMEVPAAITIVVSAGGLAPPDTTPVAPDSGLVTPQPEEQGDAFDIEGDD
ncbi:MAG TPA: PASTA domain-containing protein [Longimicrobiales bacterium]